MTLEAALDTLNGQVDTEIFVSDWFEITQERINMFADATEDHQWIHVDVERAKTMSPFGTTVAHGFLSLSLIPYLANIVVPDQPPFPGVVLSVLYGLNRVRFPHPVRPGDRIRTRTRLQSVEEINGTLQTVSIVLVEVEGQEKPGCVAEAVMRFYF